MFKSMNSKKIDESGISNAPTDSKNTPIPESGTRDSDRPLVAVYTEEELLHLYDKNPLLNYDDLVEACEAIFGSSKTISKKRYQELTKEAYQIDMESYARKHNFTDAVLLSEFFLQVSAAMQQGTTENTGRIIIIGCGQGRLAEVYVALAQKTGINTIILNDLIDDHIEATREKIRKLYGGDGSRAENVAIQYVSGDILTADQPDDNSIDAAYMWWYVGAEFCDPSSSDAMLANRKATYERIHRLLIPGGVWIDDMPDPNNEPGLYNLASIKTADILRRKNILPGTEHNLLLTNWKFEQSKGFPYQLRWAPRDGADNKIKHNADFRYMTSQSTAIPVESDYSSADVVVSTLRSIESLDTAVEVLKLQRGATVKTPKISDPLKRMRRTTMFKAI